MQQLGECGSAFVRSGWRSLIVRVPGWTSGKRRKNLSRLCERNGVSLVPISADDYRAIGPNESLRVLFMFRGLEIEFDCPTRAMGATGGVPGVHPPRIDKTYQRQAHEIELSESKPIDTARII